MKIIIAPDSFKGSISAQDLCASIKYGIKKIMPNAEVLSIPLADGGEGTMENIVEATGGRIITTNVLNPIQQSLTAAYGVLGDEKTAVIEMAQASGLPLLTESEKNPLVTTSFGTGQLIKDALDKGYRRFIIGLGGSATNDGGMGILRALGMEFYDENHNPLPEGGGLLSELALIDESSFDSRIYESEILVASDVTNPLCGENGASAIFGPQKGATPDMVRTLDHSLNHFGEIILKQKGIEVRTIPGGGAAGGIGAALVTFLNATIHSGIELIMKEVQFEQKIVGADLIFTGEGKLDHQTLSGKVIMGVSKMAQKHNIPVVALCGQLEINENALQQLGILSAFSVIKGPCTLDTAFEKTAEWTTDTVEKIMRLIVHYS